MATIVEVAERAGVSIGTVSNVIRGTARVSAALCERVERAIKDLDYHPNEIARSLKVNQTYMLGMVLPDITNPFFPEIIRGAEDQAFARGYLLVTANTDEQYERERRVIGMLRSRRVDGMLLACAPETNISHIAATIESGIPIVCFDRAVPGLKLDCVLLDNVGGAEQCVRYLIRAGYHDIAIISGSLALQTGRERLRGYELAVKQAGLPVSKDLIYEGDFRRESGYRLGKRILLRPKRPSAIFVCNGQMTLGVLEALEEMQVRCPEEIALATFDDPVGDRSFHPRLTVVAQPGYEIGSRAAQLLMDRIEGKQTRRPVTTRVCASFIVRESTPRLSGARLSLAP